MVAALLLFSLAPVPVGAFGMPELCKILTTATGTKHVADALLSDYPVFVSVKSGDPVRVRKLVAAALHGRWIEENGRLRLKAVKPACDEDFPEFERLFRIACKGDERLLQLPIHDLYQMAPGRNIRYGPTPTDYIRPLPAGLAKLGTDSKRSFLIHRMAPGNFEISTNDQEIEFSGLPKAVVDVLGDDLSKDAYLPEEVEPLRKMLSNPANLKIDWKHTDDRDPIANLENSVLAPVAKVIGKDLVIALPDFTIFSTIAAVNGGITVHSVLDWFSICNSWTVVDGAAVGCLTNCELENPAQAKRSAIQKFVDATGREGVADISALSEYVAGQRPASSDSWTDVMMLLLAGVAFDSEYAGDYPFNVRLYTELDRNDWAVLRSGQPFPASALSSRARSELLNVLLDSRSRKDADRGAVSNEMGPVSDPANWQTLDPSQLTVIATLEEKPVLIGFTSGGNVTDVREQGLNYDRRRKELDHEPLYKPAVRRRLSLKISSTGPNESVSTGFSEVTSGKSKAVVWKDLPPDLAAEFKEGIEASRRQDGGTAVPPPQNRT